MTLNLRSSSLQHRTDTDLSMSLEAPQIPHSNGISGRFLLDNVKKLDISFVGHLSPNLHG